MGEYVVLCPACCVVRGLNVSLTCRRGKSGMLRFDGHVVGTAESAGILTSLDTSGNVFVGQLFYNYVPPTQRQRSEGDVFSLVSVCECVCILICITLEPFELSTLNFYASKIWSKAQTIYKNGCMLVHCGTRVVI